MNLLSLFSGCGGMDIGFEGKFRCLKKSINLAYHADWVERVDGDWVELKPTVFNTVFANDIRPDAKITWTAYFGKKKNISDNIYHLASIVDLVKRARDGENIFPQDIDIVTGGFPCQDFSIAGKRKGFESTKSHNGKKLQPDEPSIESRGQLYMWMRDVISLTTPKMFIAENVKGLTNLKDVKEIIEYDFAKAGGDGYLVVPAKTLNAMNYGVPQSRERVIFYGFNKSMLTEEALYALSLDNIPEKYDPYPIATHGIEGGRVLPCVTCADAFIDLVEPENSTDPSQMIYSKAKFMGKHCQGQTEIKLNAPSPTIRSEHHGNIEFRRLSEEHGGRYLGELRRGLKERRLTVRECARLQTFPDDYQFIIKTSSKHDAVTSSSAYKLIGNAVPCLLAYCIAKRLEENWDLYFK